MRLMHIHLGDKGGAERFFVHLVKALADRGVSQIALTRRARVWRDEIAPVCPVYEFRYSRSVIKRPILQLRINRLADRFEADAILAWMSSAARWLPPPRPGRATAVRLGDFPETFKVFGNCQRIVCNTPEIARRCVGLGWDTNRIKVISNFTSASAAEAIPRAKLDTPANAFIIVAMGRFVERKGFDTLIEALNLVEGAVLWLLGDGPLREELEHCARQVGVWDRVRMPGWITDPGPYLRAADVLCCPSVEEPLGNVVLEAWANGVPVAATASEGPAWLIEHGRTGLLSPIGDSASLGASLRRLRDEPALRKHLIENGQAQLAARFSRDAIVDQYIDFLFASRNA